MIKIYEYLRWKQPFVLMKLWRIVFDLPRGRESIFPVSFREWESIMQERPLPGNAGILPWEVESS